MKGIITAGLLAIALTGYCAAVQAQSPREAGEDSQAKQPEGDSQAVTVDELAGPMIVRQATGLDNTEVVLANGDTIGKIDEIVHSNIDGDFYGVLEVGGVLDIGEIERRVVALKDLEYDTDEDRLYLSSTRDVEELVEFDTELYTEIDNETTVQVRSRSGGELG